jgi:hypothetical protein
MVISIASRESSPWCALANVFDFFTDVCSKSASLGRPKRKRSALPTVHS